MGDCESRLVVEVGPMMKRLQEALGAGWVVVLAPRPTGGKCHDIEPPQSRYLNLN